MLPPPLAAACRCLRPVCVSLLGLLCRDVVAISSAIVFLHRFYSTKSIVRNDPFVRPAAVDLPPLPCRLPPAPSALRPPLPQSCCTAFASTALPPAPALPAVLPHATSPCLHLPGHPLVCAAVCGGVLVPGRQG